MKTETTRVAVLAGSTRPNRRARAVAEWICADTHDDLDLVLVDLAEIGPPMLAEPRPAASGRYTLEHTKAWSELIAGFDAYVLVSPEYNHSTTAVLKNALDHLHAEWRNKTVGFAGYGTEGGVRAVEHLRLITAELGMAGVGPQVALSIFDDFDDQGRCVPRPRQVEARRRMLTGLAQWAHALRPLCETAPGQPIGEGRPSLHQPALAAEADAAVQYLVNELQAGLDGSDADRYDGMFAEDVLWGSPYGRVLAGFAHLNAAHHSLMDAPTVPASRYEPVQVIAPAPGVAIAHVRRRALPTHADAAGFSEMAMYVLIRRDGTWWLAAGQNTPIAGPTLSSEPPPAGGIRLADRASAKSTQPSTTKNGPADSTGTPAETE
jgi:uncharacterized protein (TIGR02246 family)